jgi:hypothetical protein
VLTTRLRARRPTLSRGPGGPRPQLRDDRALARRDDQRRESLRPRLGMTALRRQLSLRARTSALADAERFSRAGAALCRAATRLLSRMESGGLHVKL